MNPAETPKFYRQRFLLQFIDFAGGKLTKIDLQKLLFLAHQKANFHYFDFIPYHYGTYSFQAAADIEKLVKAGWLSISDNEINLLESTNRYEFTKTGERAETRYFFSKYKDLRGNNLVRYIYTNYPYYAQNSKIADRYLDNLHIDRGIGDGKTLYTIGYEGFSIESFINKLIKNKIHVLCDVRKNPISRKFGFSKKRMATILTKIDIQYLHIPELGIHGQNRKRLFSLLDYKKLFEKYSKDLPNQHNSLQKIASLILSGKNTALMCYECDVEYCHRQHIANYLSERHKMQIIHL